MSYAKIQNGNTLIKYPYGWSDFVFDNNNTNYPAGTDMVSLFPSTAAAVGGYTLVEPAATTPPTYTPTCQYAPVEAQPIFISGVLTQQWNAPIGFIPQVVTAAQAQIAITNAGYMSAVEAVIAAAPVTAQIAWAKATTFARPSPTIAAIASALGWTGAQVDALFIAAAAIEY
jgi:hypothetical protein